MLLPDVSNTAVIRTRAGLRSRLVTRAVSEPAGVGNPRFFHRPDLAGVG